MGMLKFEVPCTLAIEEAHRRVSALMARWEKKHGVSVQWDGVKAKLSGQAMGVRIEATLEIHGGRVAGEATDPGLLLRGQAQKYLTRKFGAYLDPTKTLEQILAAEG